MLIHIVGKRFSLPMPFDANDFTLGVGISSMFVKPTNFSSSRSFFKLITKLGDCLEESFEVCNHLDIAECTEIKYTTWTYKPPVYPTHTYYLL